MILSTYSSQIHRQKVELCFQGLGAGANGELFFKGNRTSIWKIKPSWKQMEVIVER